MPTPISRWMPDPSDRCADEPISRRVEVDDVRRVREQMALVRSLIDELERTLPRSGMSVSPRAQLIEELARLGCRALETAARMSPPDDDRPGASEADSEATAC